MGRHRNKAARNAAKRAEARLELATLRAKEKLDWQREPTEEEVQFELELFLQHLAEPGVYEQNFRV